VLDRDVFVKHILEKTSAALDAEEVRAHVYSGRSESVRRVRCRACPHASHQAERAAFSKPTHRRLSARVARKVSTSMCFEVE
jgi:hypothetical protein